MDLPALTSNGALPVESPDGQGFVINRRPSPTVIKTWDIAPTIYARGLHKLLNGEYIVCKPDGTSAWIAAGTDVSAASNWFTSTHPSRIFQGFIRSVSFVSGTWSLIIFGRRSEWHNDIAGDPATWIQLASASGGPNAGVFAAPSQSPSDQVLVVLKATADLTAGDPAGGCAMEIALIELDRT